MRVSFLRSPRGLSAGLALALVACGGGDTTQPPPPPPPPPPPAPVAVVAVEPTAVTLVPQGTQQVTATLRDAGGNVLTGRTTTWATDAPTVASVSGTGLVTALTLGTARITASSEGQSATAIVTVVNGIQVGPTGGTLVFDSGAVTLTVPAGAVPTATVLTVTKVANPVSTPPAGWQRIGPVYTVGPAGVSFAQPVTVTLAYDDEDLPPFTMTGDVGVLQWSGGTGRALTAVTVNTQAGTISGKTTGFATTASGAPAAAAAAAGGAALLADEPEVAVMVLDPEVRLSPGSASVNSSHRYATFTVAITARGEGIPLPEDTPPLLFRWRSSTNHGGLGIDAPAPDRWTETRSVEYVATNPVLSEVSGEIDRVFVDVLLNPASLTDPAAGPPRIVSAEAAVDANLELTYDISPNRLTVKQGESEDLRILIRDKAGNERSLGTDQTATWTTSGNHGRLADEPTGPTVSYEAKDELEFPPPRVDRVVMVVSELRRHDAVIREKKAIADPISGEKHALLEAVDLETTVERGRDTAFVTVEVDYEVTLTATRDTVQLGNTVDLRATLDPEEEGIRYRFTSAQTHGRLTPTSGSTSTANTSRYRANDFAVGGPETIRVEILDASLERLGEAEVVIEVDPWRLGSFTVLTQDVNCVVPYIIIPKVAGATSYEVLADRFDHPTIGTEYTKTFAGATGGTGVFSVQDGGSSWRIRMEGGGCAISDSARDAMRAAMFTRFAGIRVRFRVSGGP